MDAFDIIMAIVNIVLTVISAIGACKSIKYYKKSRHITLYADTNKALIEIEKMFNKLPEVLSASNEARRKKKGFSIENKLSSIGQELNCSLNIIRSSLPPEYIDKFEELQKDNSFDLQKYINSLISAEAVTADGIDSDLYNSCQTVLVNIQKFLKHAASDLEEKLK